MTSDPKPSGGPPSTLQAASVARVRALSRPRFEPRHALKTVSPIGLALIAVLVFAIVGIVLVYSYSILPGQILWATLERERDANAARIAELKQQDVSPEDVRNRFLVVKESLDSFRGTSLKPRVQGRLELVKEIERLTSAKGVTLASSVGFSSTTERVEDKDKRAKTRKRAGDISAFPSLRVGFSVTGTYQQLRSFISALERSTQYVIVNSVGLSAVEDAGPVRGGPRGRVGGVSPTGTITLEIDMTAYFQPEAGLVGESLAASPAGSGD